MTPVYIKSRKFLAAKWVANGKLPGIKTYGNGRGWFAGAGQVAEIVSDGEWILFDPETQLPVKVVSQTRLADDYEMEAPTPPDTSEKPTAGPENPLPVPVPTEMELLVRLLAIPKSSVKVQRLSEGPLEERFMVSIFVEGTPLWWGAFGSTLEAALNAAISKTEENGFKV